MDKSPKRKVTLILLFSRCHLQYTRVLIYYPWIFRMQNCTLPLYNMLEQTWSLHCKLSHTHLFRLSKHLSLDNIYNADCQLSIRSHNSNSDSRNKINKHIQDTDSSQTTSTSLLLKIQQTKNTTEYLIQAYSSNSDHILLPTKEVDTK